MLCCLGQAPDTCESAQDKQSGDGWMDGKLIGLKKEKQVTFVLNESPWIFIWGDSDSTRTPPSPMCPYLSWGP